MIANIEYDKSLLPNIASTETLDSKEITQNSIEPIHVNTRTIYKLAENVHSFNSFEQVEE
jgi:hypothetical protein